MMMRVFSVQHDRHGLSEVERVSAHSAGLADHVLACPAVEGVIVVATCNRMEVLIDGGADIDSLRNWVDLHFEEPPNWEMYLGEAAFQHIFDVASGLKSMVVGEREIAGQLKRSLADAQAVGQVSLPLMICVEEALKTSKQVANQTKLDAAGRSVVSQGLRLMGINEWESSRVLIVGTGAYAGAVVTSLRNRGVKDIRVHSATGRGRMFAESHGIESVQNFETELTSADLVVTCRGRGTVIYPEHVRPGMRLLDLSITRDVDRRVDDAIGVMLVDLATIQLNVEPHVADDLAAADQLIAAGVARTMARLRARVVDPVVAQLREAVMGLVDEELDRLPAQELTREDAEYALKRLAARMLHIPSTRARLAAEEGRTDEYLHAVNELYGIGNTPDPDRLDNGKCPVTSATLDDLRARRREEAAS